MGPGKLKSVGRGFAEPGLRSPFAVSDEVDAMAVESFVAIEEELKKEVLKMSCVRTSCKTLVSESYRRRCGHGACRGRAYGGGTLGHRQISDISNTIRGHLQSCLRSVKYLGYYWT